MREPDRVPGREFAVVAAATVVNLGLGILYAWSVWKSYLQADAAHPAGTPLAPPNDAWAALSGPDSTLAYSVCGLTFALCTIPGGRLQDRFGPRAGAVLGGLFLAAGCVVAGLAHGFTGLVVGFGLLGGIGVGLGYSAATPAAVSWFGPHRRGAVAGVVVGGYGAAAAYIAPLARGLIRAEGLSGSFLLLGGLLGAVVVAAGLVLRKAPPGYRPPGPRTPAGTGPAGGIGTSADRTAGQMLQTWQYYAVFALLFCSSQAGLLVIARAVPLLNQTAGKTYPVLAEHAWLLASFAAVMNAAGRVGTGFLSDAVGRVNAYTLNGLLSAGCLVALPAVVADGNVPGLFVVVGVALWQFGGGLSLAPALTADLFGAKNLGTNYGLVFLGWGFAFLYPLLADGIGQQTGDPRAAYFLSAGILLLAVAGSRFLRPPGPVAAG